MAQEVASKENIHPVRIESNHNTATIPCLEVHHLNENGFHCTQLVLLKAVPGPAVALYPITFTVWAKT